MKKKSPFTPLSHTGPVGYAYMSSINYFLGFSYWLKGCERQKHTLPVTAGKAPFECPSQEQVDWNQAKHDPTRFIAHAGGHINGRKYTNSQEAIMNSIESGQLIELDLIVTQDGKLFLRPMTGRTGQNDTVKNRYRVLASL